MSKLAETVSVMIIKNSLASPEHIGYEVVGWGGEQIIQMESGFTSATS